MKELIQSVEHLYMQVFSCYASGASIHVIENNATIPLLTNKLVAQRTTFLFSGPSLYPARTQRVPNTMRGDLARPTEGNTVSGLIDY